MRRKALADGHLDTATLTRPVILVILADVCCEVLELSEGYLERTADLLRKSLLETFESTQRSNITVRLRASCACLSKKESMPCRTDARWKTSLDESVNQYLMKMIEVHENLKTCRLNKLERTTTWPRECLWHESRASREGLKLYQV